MKNIFENKKEWFLTTLESITSGGLYCGRNPKNHSYVIYARSQDMF